MLFHVLHGLSRTDVSTLVDESRTGLEPDLATPTRAVGGTRPRRLERGRESSGLWRPVLYKPLYSQHVVPYSAHSLSLLFARGIRTVL